MCFITYKIVYKKYTIHFVVYCLYTIFALLLINNVTFLK